MRPIRLYRDFIGLFAPRIRAVRAARRAAAFSRGLLAADGKSRRGLQFLFYHYVFDDQKRGFERQLQYLKSIGEVIAPDAALDLIRSGRQDSGRYFCLGFDDGFASCYHNALQILGTHQLSAAFFLPTSYVGLRPERDAEHMRRFLSRRFDNAVIEFLDWDQCRAMQRAGMTIGSHSVHHARLSKLDETAAIHELAASRAKIQEELDGARCIHFSAPVGGIGRDINPARDYGLAARCGYESVHTTSNIVSHMSNGVAVIGRRHVLAHWTIPELRTTLGS